MHVPGPILILMRLRNLIEINGLKIHLLKFYNLNYLNKVNNVS